METPPIIKDIDASLPVKEIMDKWGFVALSPEAKDPYVIEIKEGRLQLARSSDEKFGSVYVDFCSRRMTHRRKYGGHKQEPIAKAIGVKKGALPSVLDSTAGFGRDAFILASLGCRVHMIERSKIVAALLEDGLRRAGEDDKIGLWVKARLSFACQDSCKGFSNLPFPPDVVYLDPMFPAKRKSALVKKEMQALQALIGIDTDADGLFALALDTAKTRVVVKRPAVAEFLAGQRPDTSIKSGHYRFDLYIKDNIGRSPLI